MDSLRGRVNKLCALVFPAGEETPAADARGEFERFAIPYTFAPRLRLAEAIVFTFVALTRIFVGSLLFALWGVVILNVWAQIHNPVLRVLAVTPLLAGFALTLVLGMAGIALVFDRERLKSPEPSVKPGSED